MRFWRSVYEIMGIRLGKPGYEVRKAWYEVRVHAMQKKVMLLPFGLWAPGQGDDKIVCIADCVKRS